MTVQGAQVGEREAAIGETGDRQGQFARGDAEGRGERRAVVGELGAEAMAAISVPARVERKDRVGRVEHGEVLEQFVVERVPFVVAGERGDVAGRDRERGGRRSEERDSARHRQRVGRHRGGRARGLAQQLRAELRTAPRRCRSAGS